MADMAGIFRNISKVLDASAKAKESQNDLKQQVQQASMENYWKRAMSDYEHPENQLKRDIIQGFQSGGGKVSPAQTAGILDEKTTYNLLAQQKAKYDQDPKSVKWEKSDQDTYDALGQKLGFQPKGQGGIVIPQNLKPLPSNATEEQKEKFLSNFDTVTQENIKSVADYTADLTKMTSFFKSGERRQLEGLVKMYNPDWSMPKYNQAQRYLNQLASGSLTSVGGQVNSLNTLAAHIKEFDDTIEQYKGSKLPAKAAMIKFAQRISGDPNITDYNTAKSVVDTESERLLTAVGVTQEGMKERRSLLGGGGYDQMKQYAITLTKIASKRGRTLEQQYKNNMGRNPKDEIIFPETREIYKKFIPEERFLSDENTTQNSVDLSGWSDADLEKIAGGK